MHTKHKLKSTLLIIVAISLLYALPVLAKVSAEEPQMIALFYTDENCPACVSTLELIKSRISDNFYIDERSITESATSDEYEMLKQECEIESSKPPLLVTQNGCFLTETKILAEIDSIIELLEDVDEADVIEESDNDITESEATDTTTDSTNTDAEDIISETVNPPVTEETDQTILESSTEPQKGSTLIAIISFAIPIFMFWAVFTIIKKLNL